MSLALGIMISPVAGTGLGGDATILSWPESLAWWDSAYGLSLASAQVTAWADRKGGYSPAQGVSASRPLLGDFNGPPAIVLDSVDDELTLASQPFGTGAIEREIWGVIQQDGLVADTVSRAFFSFGGDTNLSQVRAFRFVTGGNNRASAQIGTGSGVFGNPTNTASFSSRHVVRIRLTSSGVGVSIDNGAETFTAGVPAIGSSRVRIGSFANTTPSNFWNGKIRDILVTSLLSADKATFMWNFLLPRRML